MVSNNKEYTNCYYKTFGCVKFQCQCGRYITHHHIAVHNKTKIHINNISLGVEVVKQKKIRNKKMITEPIEKREGQSVPACFLI